MKARVLLLLLLAGTSGAETVVPKPRPRLPPVAGEVKQEASSLKPGFRSFDDYLHAEGRRPVGLDALPEVAAARSEKAATEPKAGAAKDSPATPEPVAPGILVLPKMEVTTEKMTELKKEVAAVEANQSWEEHSAEAWKNTGRLDAILNPPFLRQGSYSADRGSAIARERVELLRWVKILKISLAYAKTPAEKARIQADINSITDVMQLWDLESPPPDLLRFVFRGADNRR